MIGSFWNLCRACPSMPVDKQLHSEYRSTYTWHEYTGPHQEHAVVRRSPQPAPVSTKQANLKLQSAKSTEDDNSEGPTLEPAMPRRKKCPELAYKSHEFMMAADGGGLDAIDSNVIADKTQAATAAPVLPTSQLSKAISRISTEYRLQFAWPRRSQLTNGDASGAGGQPAAGGGGHTASGLVNQGTTAPPRKSLSMGALKQGVVPSAPAPVHKKRTADVDRKRDDVQPSELEPLVGSNGTDAADGTVVEGDEQDDEPLQPKVTFRSVTKEEKEQENTRKIGPVPQPNSMPPAGRPSSVQVRPSSVQQQRPANPLLQDDAKTDNERAIARARKDFLIRHHLDRTTGVGDGALLPSPTREKLEPVIPRRRDESNNARDEIQPRTKSSPKNSPRAGRSQSLGPSVAERKSPKRQPVRAPSVAKEFKERSKDVRDKEKEPIGDRATEPARHPRPTSLATNAPANRPLHHAKPATAIKPPVNNSVHSSVTHPPTSAAAVSKLQEIRATASAAAKRSLTMNQAQVKLAGPATRHARPKTSSNDIRYASRAATIRATGSDAQTNGEAPVAAESGEDPPIPSSRTVPANAGASPWLDDEPVVKSPPEPTRVKSPEQMIMRSPEPVNWTVPLDTGKTFTVTQNVREGEPSTRPHSEARTWGASSLPPIPQSASPDLPHQHKSQHSQYSGYKSPESESVSLGSFSGLNGHKDQDSGRESPLPQLRPDSATTPAASLRNHKALPDSDNPERVAAGRTEDVVSARPVAGTNLRCLDDPVFALERKKESATPPGSGGYRVLEAEVPRGSEGPQRSQTAVEAPSGYRVLGPTESGVEDPCEVLDETYLRFQKFWSVGRKFDDGCDRPGTVRKPAAPPVSPTQQRE
ncbi:proteoglycan 4 isoform X3 [Athalia rosae]|uniref:proteoglycan 4 isoform X3 n=1 Tax=Athalia rosae TaxID=37344 RepID=UPI002033FA3E|nr:proteoglycan 4 isoform X3 [Athalia rosae]